MFIAEMTRRAALGAFAAAPVLLSRGALARRVMPGVGIRVDVTPLRESAGDPTAAWVARELPGALAQAMAERGSAGAPIAVRIDYVMLGPSSGGECGPTPDQMVGVVTIGGVDRPLRASARFYPSPVDQALVEQSNHDRVSQLVQAFAYWAVREG
ncbi:MAG: hypothetical protein JO312_08505 [Hyphomicrobiales bacterium]|nr:hypothetical protein [Hyphomicrobiales bacterium]